MTLDSARKHVHHLYGSVILVAEEPRHEPVPVLSQRLRRAMIGPGDVAVERHRDIQDDLRTLPVTGISALTGNKRHGEMPPEFLVIEVTTTPRNQKHFGRLMSFARDVLGVCDEVGIKPILSASLAVFAYTQDPTMEVHDVDLSCSESHFPRLRQALEERGIDCRITNWHVLQAVRTDLKVEFDATEYWMQDIPEHYECARIGDVQFWMIGVDGLRELYRRGLIDTADKFDDNDQIKHRAIKEKLRALDALQI